MAGNRTLKLSILADVDDLNKKLKAANGDVEDSAGKLKVWQGCRCRVFSSSSSSRCLCIKDWRRWR